MSDIEKGVTAFSSDLVKEIGLEIRDVFPAAENVLYALIGEAQMLSEKHLAEIFEYSGIPASKSEEIVRLLLWYGVLGVVGTDGNVTYIYNLNYEMAILSGIIRKLGFPGLSYLINPAFVAGLQIRTDRN